MSDTFLRCYLTARSAASCPPRKQTPVDSRRSTTVVRRLNSTRGNANVVSRLSLTHGAIPVRTVFAEPCAAWYESWGAAFVVIVTSLGQAKQMVNQD
jgi:hypothetical protein